MMLVMFYAVKQLEFRLAVVRWLLGKVRNSHK